GKPMIRALLCTITLTAPLAAFAAEGVPVLKVEESCRAVAAIADGQVVSEQKCLAQEHSARLQLTEVWSQFERSDQQLCISQTSLGGIPSYVELLACMETARDARKLRAPARA